MTLIGIEPNMAMFIRPKRLVDSAWIGHAPFAAWLTAMARPRRFVELGTHRGMSYSTFCQTVLAEQLLTKCHAVDTWQGDEHSGAYGEDVYEDLSSFNARHFAGFSHLMRTGFDEAVLSFADGSIDLLHIDGLHTYEAVRHDFETWLPKLSDRAIVLFHDTAVRERGFGVWRYWNEISLRYPHFEFEHASGLGVLQVGTEVATSIRQLLDLGQDVEGARRVKAIFSGLGDAIVQRHELENASRPPVHGAAVSVELQARALAVVNGALAYRLAQSESMVRRLAGSFSWRVTRPLRAVRGLFKWRY
ncbi:class I SAM-dependent methyltransferase [Variovorax sp. W2I14]|uniref:class I SAM-dependent methyltransferase n=1 Tax=Variovorax sp. W2I14 TaxID=3042290 RepID=UPI003D1AD7B8